MLVHLDRQGQRFGPYSVDEINAYLAEGLVEATDLAWYDGCPDWMALEAVPGVNLGKPAASAPLKAPPPPSAPPAPAAPVAGHGAHGAAEAGTEIVRKVEELPEDIRKRPHEMEADTCLFNGWIFFRLHPWAMLLAAVILIPLGLVSVALVLPAGPLLGGAFYFFLQKKRSRKDGIGTFFTGFGGRFLQLMLAWTVPLIIILVSVVPGILLLWGSVYSFDLYVVGAELAGVWDAVGIVAGSAVNVATEPKTLDHAWVLLQAALWTAGAQIFAFFSTLGTMSFGSQLGLFVGTLLIFVPPVYLMLNWIFAVALVMHYRLGFWEAMELSREVTKKDVGGLAFYVGMVVLFNLMGVAIIGMGRVLITGETGAMVGGVLLIVVGAAAVVFSVAVSGASYAVVYEEYCAKARKMEDVPQWLIYCFLAGAAFFMLTLFLGVVQMIMSSYQTG